jgi:ribonucleotide reductase beta subunit family protein with ferritin-like domain
MLSDWAFKWIESSESFAKRLIAFAVVEGVIFSGAFASIFWLKYRKSNGKLFLSGLIKSNEFIARDEGLHTIFACELYQHIENKLSRSEVIDIIRDGVNCTLEFMTDALPVKLLGMNNNDMCQYVQFVADRLIVQLGYTAEWNVSNPFDFMEAIGMTSKTNFFEKKVADYALANKEIKEDTFDLSECF